MASGELKVEMEEVTLSAKNHFQALNDGLWELFTTNSMLDVTLTCHGKSLKVHRLLLAIFSPILKDALVSVSSEKDADENCLSIGKGGEKTLLLSLDYITAEEASYVHYLIEFLYRGSITMPKEGLDSLLQTARVLAVQGLVDAIEEFIDGEMARAEGHDDGSERAMAKGHARDNEAGVSSAGLSDNRVMSKQKQVQAAEVLMDDDMNPLTGCEDPHQSTTEQFQDNVRMTRRSSQRVLKMVGPSCKAHVPEETIKEHHIKSESMIEQSDMDIPGDMALYLARESSARDDLTCEKEQKLDQDEATADEESVLGVASAEANARKRQRRKPLQPKKVVREPEKDKGESRRIFIKEYCKIWRQTRPVMRCHYCDYETQDKGSYKSHIARHDPSAERFQCDICGKSFRSKNGIRGHMRSHGDPECLHKCTHCEFQTPQKWNWLKHLAVIHKVDPDGNPLLENIKCEQCQFQCVANHQLKAHMLRHHTLDKPFKCTECDYAAVIKHELNKHISISHKKERFYACDICGFRSQTQGGLTRHRRTHTGEKPFKCDLCEMCYADRGKLKVHILRHAREKKLQYSIIGHS